MSIELDWSPCPLCGERTVAIEMAKLRGPCTAEGCGKAAVTVLLFAESDPPLLDRACEDHRQALNTWAEETSSRLEKNELSEGRHRCKPRPVATA